MDKIIAALDGLQYSESTRDYAIALAHHSKAHLVGVFLDDPTYTSYKIYEMVEQGGISEDKIRHLETNDKNARAKAADDFEKNGFGSGSLFFSFKNSLDSEKRKWGKSKSKTRALNLWKRRQLSFVSFNRW